MGLTLSADMGAWRITCHWPEGAPRGGPASMHIEAVADAPADVVARGITTTTLRRLPLPEMIAEAERQATAPPARDALRKPRPGRGGHPDVFYARVASVFVRMVSSGSRTPTEDVAAEMAASYGTAAQWIKEARKRGVLSSIGKGRLGGELTGRAHELLALTSTGEAGLT